MHEWLLELQKEAKFILEERSVSQISLDLFPSAWDACTHDVTRLISWDSVNATQVRSEFTTSSRSSTLEAKVYQESSLASDSACNLAEFTPRTIRV